jgi:hypothetical protein
MSLPRSGKNKIEEIKKTLFSRSAPASPDERAPLSHETLEVPVGWRESENVFQQAAQTVMPQRTAPRRRRFAARMFLIAAAVFFALAVAFAAYIFYHDKNSLSLSNVDVRVVAPVSIGGGEELPLQITVDNLNNAGLESAALVIMYPDGTHDPVNREKEMPRSRDEIGTIPAGGSVTRSKKAVIFGEEHSVKKITVSLEYRVKGSNAIFEKNKSIEVEIATAPVSLAVSAIKEVSADQNFEIVATVSSNSQSVVSGILLSAEYPFGFKFVSADPQVIAGTDTWRLGDLAPGERRIIRVRGSLSGQNDDERAFRFSVGTADRSDSKRIGTKFVTYVQNIAIKRPFIGMNIIFDGGTSEEYTVPSGRQVAAGIRWKNNLTSRIADAVIEVRIRGASLDRSTIRPQNGFYRSVDDVVVFDRTQDSRLALLNPGDTADSVFKFNLVSPSKAASLFLQNQKITIEASVSGKRMSGDEVMDALAGSAVREVKVSSDLSMSARSSYSGSSIPIVNTGPIPPRANQETRYTVTWTLTNTFNGVSNVRVIAPPLPTYSRWTGVVYPVSENVRQADDGSIIWDVGEVKPYAGYSSPTREVSFQVSVIPSITQIEDSPEIVRPAEYSGTDRFTGQTLMGTSQNVTTNISTDPTYKDGDGTVVR